MEKKEKLLLIILAFVLLLGGAYLLYNKLGNEMAPEQLSVQEAECREEESDKAVTEDSAEGEESKGDADASDNTAASDDCDKNEKENAKKSEDSLAPDFTVYDIDGNEVHLTDYIGKPIVLNFWASWCGPCQMEMPDFQEKYLELKRKSTSLW